MPFKSEAQRRKGVANRAEARTAASGDRSIAAGLQARAALVVRSWLVHAG